jgi:hypothetical protein
MLTSFLTGTEVNKTNTHEAEPLKSVKCARSAQKQANMKVVSRMNEVLWPEVEV